MKYRVLAAAGFGLTILIACFAVQAADATAVQGLPILVRVSLSPNFNNDMKEKTSFRDDSDSLSDAARRDEMLVGALRPEEIRSNLIGQMRSRIASWDTSSTVRLEFCNSDEELAEKVSKKQGYLALNVVLRERKAFRAGSYYDFALTASVELYRLTGGRWEKLVDGRYEAEEPEYKKGVKPKSDITVMVDILDEMVMKNMVFFEPLNSTTRDSRTKIIKIRVGNPTACDITMIKWQVPASMDVLEAKTEGRLKPGALADVTITVTSDKSHSAIQWRDILIGQMTFAKPK